LNINDASIAVCYRYNRDLLRDTFTQEVTKHREDQLAHPAVSWYSCSVNTCSLDKHVFVVYT